MVCMGVFSSLSKAMDAALKEIKKTDVDNEVYEDCYLDLINYRQTHGLDENWHIEVVELDKFGEVWCVQMFFVGVIFLFILTYLYEDYRTKESHFGCIMTIAMFVYGMSWYKPIDSVVVYK